MKKLTALFLSVLALGITVTSCSDDDSNSNSTPSVQGKWNFSTYKTLDTNGNPTGEATPIDGLNTKNDQTCLPIKVDAMTFNASPTNGVYTDFPSSGCESTDYPFTYTRTANHIVVTGLPIAVEFDVVSSTSTQLVMNLRGTNVGDIQITFNKG